MSFNVIGHSAVNRSHDFLLMCSSNYVSILYRFRDVTFYLWIKNVHEHDCEHTFPFKHNSSRI